MLTLSEKSVLRKFKLYRNDNPQGLTLTVDDLFWYLFPMKPTYNPSKLRRARKFGFRKRNQTSAGRKVLRNRRRKGRAKLTASVARRFR
jgi:large subunit ribosomal protein L34